VNILKKLIYRSFYFLSSCIRGQDKFKKIVIDDYGSIKYYFNSQLHREDGPAIEGARGHKEWWIHGQRHRVDGPAIEYVYGNKHWYLHGELHREDGPAVVLANG
jgi:hypothetical protein